MSTEPIILVDENAAAAALDVMTYASTIAKVDHRTVREWLRKGLLPGAYQDARNKWWIPADARKLERPLQAVEPAQEPHHHDAAQFPRRPRGAFTVAEAAALLYPITERYIRRHKTEFKILEGAGEHGADLVPGHVIREWLGL